MLRGTPQEASEHQHTIRLDAGIQQLVDLLHRRRGIVDSAQDLNGQDGVDAPFCDPFLPEHVAIFNAADNKLVPVAQPVLLQLGWPKAKSTYGL